LETQIRRWWANLHQASKQRGFHISEVAGVCRGRFKERPALRDVAAALWAMLQIATLTGVSDLTYTDFWIVYLFDY